MGANEAASGPDFSLGVKAADIPAKGVLAGRVGEEPVLLSRLDGALFAVGGACTHYGASLAGGVTDGGTIRCPLHHACFNLRTGAATCAPAFDPLPRWRVEQEGELVFVRSKEEPVEARIAAPADSAGAGIVIVGGGAAAYACATELRRVGFTGKITLLSADSDAPYDRPNLSKDYLAGTAPEAWIPLRDDGFYAAQAIDLRLRTEVARIDSARKVAVTTSGEAFPYDRLLLATGAEPVRLPLPGFDRENVHVLRSLGDARSLIARAKPGARAAVLGASFVGLEAAAALRARGVEVEIVSNDAVPFGRLFGREIGLFLQRLYEENGVRFHLACTPESFDGRNLSLQDGKIVKVDFVVAGVGVRPRTGLRTPGMAVADGILVDSTLATNVPDIYAAGDVAAYPDPLDGRPIRIEHWVTAERQGQTAARNMMGMNEPFAAIPFFWTEHFGIAFRYVGHCRNWDEIRIDGDVASRSFIARFMKGGEVRASLACNRDRDCLEDELALERRIAQQDNPPRAAAPAPAGLTAPGLL